MGAGHPCEISSPSSLSSIKGRAVPHPPGAVCSIEVTVAPGSSPLRWPIRNQILVPFVGVALLAVLAMTAVAALAARQRETETLNQLRNVVETLAHTSVTYNEPVLQKM